MLDKDIIKIQKYYNLNACELAKMDNKTINMLYNNMVNHDKMANNLLNSKQLELKNKYPILTDDEIKLMSIDTINYLLDDTKKESNNHGINFNCKNNEIGVITELIEDL